jgi:hypothetical protein
MRFIRAYLGTVSPLDLDEKEYAALERIAAKESALREIPGNLSFLYDLAQKHEALGMDNEHARELQALIISSTSKAMAAAHRKKK